MRLPVFLFATLSIGVVTFLSCTNNTAKPETSQTTVDQPISQDSLVKRGNYLVATIGCDDCHSPKTMGPKGPQLDMERRLSGYPSDRPIAKADKGVLQTGYFLMGGDLTSSVGPWGMSFAANLTSDSTGIGNWTEDQFLTAMRKGKFKGLESNRDLLPPMPWQNFKNLTDHDLKAIFAYLKFTRPVHNVVPAPVAPTQL
jgi:hypothetical protein